LKTVLVAPHQRARCATTDINATFGPIMHVKRGPTDGSGRWPAASDLPIPGVTRHAHAAVRVTGGVTSGNAAQPSGLGFAVLASDGDVTEVAPHQKKARANTLVY
jgi:hypothetical protein